MSARFVTVKSTPARPYVASNGRATSMLTESMAVGTSGSMQRLNDGRNNLIQLAFILSTCI